LLIYQSVAGTVRACEIRFRRFALAGRRYLPISDGYIIVGAFRDDDKRINAGAAYIYTNFRDEELNYSEISVTPSAYDFGETETNTTLETTLTISNTGTGDLSLDTITITGTDASDFTITTDNCSGQTLSPEAECTVTVAFSPTSP